MTSRHLNDEDGSAYKRIACVTIFIFIITPPHGQPHAVFGGDREFKRLYGFVFFCMSGSHQEAKKYFLEKHPSQLINLLGKLFVFSFTWSMGGILRRQEDADEDESVNRRGGDRQEVEVDICNEFDNFVREMFEVEPPIGKRCVDAPVEGWITLPQTL